MLTLFFFSDTPTTEIYTLSLHDALPIYRGAAHGDPGTARGRSSCARDRPPAGHDGAEQPIPPGEIETVVAVGLAWCDRVVDTVHLGGDQDRAQHPRRHVERP